MSEAIMTEFINIAIQTGGWMALDRVYLENRLETLVGEGDFTDGDSDVITKKKSLELLDDLLALAITNKKLKSSDLEEREKLSRELMDILTPPPSVVNALFSQHYDISVEEATDYYHELNSQNGFINTATLSENTLEIGNSTLLIQQKEDNTFLGNNCQQCFESEGLGTGKNRNKRIIRMNLRGESWGFYYDPAALIEEHSVFTPETHESFELNRNTQETMLRLLEVYPHYFISFDVLKNSMKDHGFFFGGQTSLPLIQAADDYPFDIPGFVTVKASLVDWPLSVIRLRTSSKKNLINSIEYLTLRWQQYSYPSLGIIAKDEEGEPCHSIIPLFRWEEEEYIAELLLVDSSLDFKRTPEYENLLLDKKTIVDALGVMTIRADLTVNDRLAEIVKENFAKQLIFKKSTEGKNAFIRFIDTL